jgi:hypothetical protein
MKNKDTNQRSIPISASDASNDQLERRLASEVSSVEARIESMRQQAAESVRQRNAGLDTFVAAVNQIDALLQTKIAALTTENVLRELTRTEKYYRAGLPDGLFSGMAITYSMPHSSECPAKVEQTFDIQYDGLGENAVVNYSLQIIPVFFKFENASRIVVPFAQVNGELFTQWIDDRIVEFTKAFFKIRFHDQYQKNHMVTDPVLNIQFPKAFAVGSQEQNGTVFHFYTKESRLKFQDAPLNLLTSFTGVDPSANHCI